MNTVKQFIIIFILFLCFGCASKTAIKFETANVCITSESASDADKIKIALEKKALDKILNKYQDISVQNIIFTDRFYYNLKEMSKYCLKTKISVTTSNKKKKTDKIKAYDFCYSNPEIKLSDLEKTAVLKAIQSKIFELHPQTKQADWDLINKTIFDINYSTPVINLQKNSICFDLTAKYYPEDINLLTITKNQIKNKFLLNENFLQLKNTPIKINKYGKNLVLKKINNSYFLTTSKPKGSQAVFQTNKIQNISIKAQISKKELPCLNKQKTIKILDIEYVNRQRDDLKLVSQKKNNNVCHDVVLGRQKSQNNEIELNKKINEIEIVKKGRQIKIFFNQVLAGTFLASGDAVKNVKVHLNPATFLNKIIIKEL